MKKIYLVRHGETPWTISGQHTGLTDISLTENGRLQAESLGKRLQGHQFEKVLISPLKRASETAQLADLHGEEEPDLVEWNYGKYEGLTHEEIAAQDPCWTIFSRGAPGGESVEEIGKRADRVIKKISACKGDVLLVSSGHILRVLTARWLGLSPAEGRLFLLSTGSVSLLGYERQYPVIIFWNSTQ